MTTNWNCLKINSPTGTNCFKINVQLELSQHHLETRCLNGTSQTEQDPAASRWKTQLNALVSYLLRGKVWPLLDEAICLSARNCGHHSNYTTIRLKT